MKEQCEGCGYQFGSKVKKQGCRAFIEIIPNCWNKTTKADRKRREIEIKHYGLYHD